MAVKIIGLKDNIPEVLVPNQFSSSPITLTGTYQDITPNQVLNVQGFISFAVWFNLSTNTNLVFKIKCYNSLNGTLDFTNGYSVHSLKTSSGHSAFSDQSYNITSKDGGNIVVQVPVVDLVNNVKIFVKGSGEINSCEVTSQSRGA